MFAVTPPSAGFRWLPATLILLAALLLLGQQTLRIPGDSRLAATIHDAMHVPWSMVLSLIVWKLTGRWRHAVLIMPLIGIGSELLQELGGRTASASDLFSDMLGLGLAGCLYALVVPGSRRTIWLPVLGILCISLYTLRPIVMVWISEDWLWARASVLFDGADPRGFYLADFTAETDYNMFSDQGIRMILTDQPWSGVHLRVFPGVRTLPEFLRLEITVNDTLPLTLGLSARYWRNDTPVWTDFHAQPGYSTVLIPTRDISRDRWLPAIQDLYLYGYSADAGRSFHLHRAEFVASAD